ARARRVRARTSLDRRCAALRPPPPSSLPRARAGRPSLPALLASGWTLGEPQRRSGVQTALASARCAGAAPSVLLEPRRSAARAARSLAERSCSRPAGTLACVRRARSADLALLGRAESA